MDDVKALSGWARNEEGGKKVKGGRRCDKRSKKLDQCKEGAMSQGTQATS